MVRGKQGLQVSSGRALRTKQKEEKAFAWTHGNNVGLRFLVKNSGNRRGQPYNVRGEAEGARFSLEEMAEDGVKSNCCL